jgi:hypothetical protein
LRVAFLIRWPGKIPAGSVSNEIVHITDPKEEYNMASEATWVLPVMFKKIIAFQQMLVQEPPIPLGTPDPYVPGK